VDLISARQTEQEKGRDYMQFVASTMGIGIALVIVLIFAIIGALVSKVVALIKGKTPPKQLEAPKTDPPTEEPKTEAETVPGKGALIADIQNALASLKTVREAIRQTPRPAERAPLEARAQQIEERLGRLKEDAGRAVTPDDLQRTRQELQEAQTDIDGLKRDAKVAEVPGRPTLQEGVRTARQRAANIRQRVEGLRGNDQAELRPRVDAVDAELGRLERTAQDVPTQEQVSRLNDALDKVLKEMDAMEKDPLLELGLRGEAVRALESLENIKRDPVGDINSKVNERGDPKNHYEAARREAAGEVIARRADGRPFSHVGDLQRAFDGLDNVRRALQREMDNPAPSTTPRGLDVLVKKFSEVQQLLSRLKGFLDSIGQGNFPPYHEFPPGA